jgi:hypothetical protein
VALAAKLADNNFTKLKQGKASAGFNISGEPRLSSSFVYIDAIKPL